MTTTIQSKHVASRFGTCQFGGQLQRPTRVKGETQRALVFIRSRKGTDDPLPFVAEILPMSAVSSFIEDTLTAPLYACAESRPFPLLRFDLAGFIGSRTFLDYALRQSCQDPAQVP